MKKAILFFIFIILIWHVRPTHAVYDPTSVPNNRFGIHIIDENDLEDAARLVNSSGGKWGYVTVVIREDDRKVEKWQPIFDKMRRLRLLPSVRLATRVENGHWVKPRDEDIGSWVDFLNSVNWVSENRYVIIFNEPNHATEWGGAINPEEYAHFLKVFSQKFKQVSPDFFILPAGLDASAPNGYDTMDEASFLSRMWRTDNSIFSAIDGWSSHSYPAGFVGSPYGTGRGSVRSFQWELSELSRYGVKTDQLPIFITETGWQHQEGQAFSSGLPTTFQVGSYFSQAYESAWNDPRIVAITPFLLNYQSTPFDHFSWRKFASSEFHPMYEMVQKLTKVGGQPKQRDNALISPVSVPDKLVINSDYTFAIQIANQGQSIVSTDDDWTIELFGLPPQVERLVDIIHPIEPFQNNLVEIHLKTPKDLVSYGYEIQLKHRGDIISLTKQSMKLVAPPLLTVKAKSWIDRSLSGSDFSLIIYDMSDHVVAERQNITFTNGVGQVSDLYNIAPGQTYRVVLKKPHYLPRQIINSFNEDKTEVTFPRLLPLDPTGDGQLSLYDVQEFLRHPLDTLRLLIAL